MKNLVIKFIDKLVELQTQDYLYAKGTSTIDVVKMKDFVIVVGREVKAQKCSLVCQQSKNLV